MRLQPRVVRAYLSVIDVTNGTNIDVRLGALESSVCAVDVCEASGRLGVQGGLKGARVAVLEAAARGPQKGREGTESGRHDGESRLGNWQLQEIQGLEEENEERSGGWRGADRRLRLTFEMMAPNFLSFSWRSCCRGQGHPLRRRCTGSRGHAQQ